MGSQPPAAQRLTAFDADAFERAFLDADYRRCRDVLAEAPDTNEALLAASRVDLREGRNIDVVERLSALHPESAKARAERDMWLGTAFAAIGDMPSAARLLDAALESSQGHRELHDQALFQRAHAFWIERDYQRVRQLASRLSQSKRLIFRARAHILTGWCLASGGDARGQAREYVRALDLLERMQRPDRQVHLSTVYTLASLARELGLKSAIQRVRRAYERIVPSGGLGTQYFKLTRVLGWIDALEGDELSAFRRFRRAAESAPSRHWHVMCTCDRARLARAAGERAFALDQLYAAHEAASALSWNDATEEDRLALLQLAELFADVDGAVAQRYLAQFRSLRTPMDRRMGFANDPRLSAMEAYSSGAALLRLGDVTVACDMLVSAYDTFARFGYGWRAALAALGLYRATSEPTWLVRAWKAAERWPRSWIARDVRVLQRDVLRSEERAVVSRAQRPVLQLLLEGRRNAEIARTLELSPNTVRNHIAELYRKFGVNSRAELIAMLSKRKL